MKIQNLQSRTNSQFGGFTDLMMSNVFLNKTLFDLTGSDIPWVIMANNNEERRERINRSALSIGMVFISPIVVLPFVNRFAMKHVAKLTTKMFSEDYNAIRLSNKYLVNAEKTKIGLEELAKESISSSIPKLLNLNIKGKTEQINLDNLLNRVNGDYEELRKRIAKAKGFVLGSDALLIAGTFGQIGFYNNHQTEKKTGQAGFSAELKMANKEIVEKRAATYKRNEKMRYAIYLAGLASFVAGMPLLIKHGLLSKKTNGLSNFVKKHCELFDYNDAIFTKRLPLCLTFLCSLFGIMMASRNNTERKDNLIRGGNAAAIFYLGDILLASTIGRASDKLLGTKIIKHDNEKTFLNKVLPPMKSLDELKAINCPKTLKTAKAIFWANFTFLSALMGFITPYFINKIIKHDVSKDVKNADYNKN